MKQKWVKRIARAILPCFVFFVFSFSFAPKAHAVVIDSNITYGYQSTVSTPGSMRLTAATAPLPIVSLSVSENLGTVYTFRTHLYLFVDGNVTFSGPVKLYASYYTNWTPQGNVGVEDGYIVSYINSNNQTGSVEGGLDSISPFTADNGTTGYAIEASWQASEALPIRSLSVRGSDVMTNAFIGKGTCTYFFPSIRVIASEYNAELDSLDNIADEIAAQSDILLAMKGDIVAILQDIYTMTGDMYAAQNLLNTYISQMLPLLENIDRTTTNIYSLLSTQLRLLETAIENAADSVEAAISAQTAAMIAYLEQYFNTGNEIPDDTYQQQQDAANILDQMESLEKPNVDTIVPEIGDYSDSGVSGVLSAIFSSNLIVTMMTLSASFAFGAYVLFGKRE